MTTKLTWRDIVPSAGKSSFTPRNLPREVITRQRESWSPAIPQFVPSSPASPAGSKAAPSKGARTAATVPSALEEEFALILRAFGLPKPERQHKFDANRNWRFDFAWVDQLVAVEIEGGIWSRGKSGHTSGSGITRDAEKSNAAQLQGWLVLRFVESHLKDGSAIAWTRQALGFTNAGEPSAPAAVA